MPKRIFKTQSSRNPKRAAKQGKDLFGKQPRPLPSPDRGITCDNKE